MPGKYQLEITETEAELKQMLIGAKRVQERERIQFLYLLKTQKVKTIQEAATILGRNRVTLQVWARRYKKEGLTALLIDKVPTGRPRVIPNYIETALRKKLSKGEGFNNYQEICQWIESNFGLKVTYKTVHKLVHYHLKSSPKIVQNIGNLN